MKIKIKTTILLVIVICLFSCDTLDNPKVRNKLIFNDRISFVTDSVNAMNKILLKTGRKFSIYGIDVDMNNINRDENEFFLYVNDVSHSVQKVGELTDSTLYKSKLLEFINSTDRKHFINLALYLNKNHLSTCYIENNQPSYMYRADIYMADRQKDLDRFVVFANSEQEIDLNQYKILDKSKNMYLIANKDAKIWSKE